MGYSTWMLDACTAEFAADRDVDVRAEPGWQTRGDPANHQGVMDHHMGQTAGSTFAANVNYALDGYPWPPAYNIATSSPIWSPDTPGMIYITVLAAGRANHAGVADRTHDDFDEWAAREGNPRFIGLGHYGRPGQRWDPFHLRVQMRLDACLLEAMGQPASHQADHKDYATGRKGDRHTVDTAMWRRDLTRMMADRTSPPKGPEMTPAQLVTAIRDSADYIADAVWARPFRSYVTGESQSASATLYAAQRDAAAARVTSQQSLAVVRKVAAEIGMADADVDRIASASARETIEMLGDGVDLTLTLNQKGTP